MLFGMSWHENGNEGDYGISYISKSYVFYKIYKKNKKYKEFCQRNKVKDADEDGKKIGKVCRYLLCERNEEQHG